MNTQNHADKPIIIGINPNTSRRDGDDDGYREWPVSPYDAVNPDLIVVSQLPQLAINFAGQTKGLMQVLAGGIPNAPKKVAVRLPFELGLREAAALILKRYGKHLFAIDGMRDARTQGDFWAHDFRLVRRLNDLADKPLGVRDVVSIGLRANSNTSYAPAVKNDAFKRLFENLMTGEKKDEVTSAAIELSGSKKTYTATEIAELFVTFQAGLRLQSGLVLDEEGATAHGNGGAADLWLLENDGRYANMGAPYSYVNPPDVVVSPTVMEYFELVTLEDYQAAVAADPALLWYLEYYGIKSASQVTQAVFEEARRNRRILFHTMMEVGATFFSMDETCGEFWHYQTGNERDGRQATVSGLEGSGNTCHAVLAGKPMAAWTNAVGHRLSREMGLIPPLAA